MKGEYTWRYPKGQTFWVAKPTGEEDVGQTLYRVTSYSADGSLVSEFETWLQIEATNKRQALMARAAAF